MYKYVGFWALVASTFQSWNASFQINPRFWMKEAFGRLESQNLLETSSLKLRFVDTRI